MRLAARMLIAAGLERDDAAADARVRDALGSGAGLEKLRQIIEFQGGDPHVVDDYSRLPSSPDRQPVPAPRTGHVTSLLAEHVGRAAVWLGAGRGKLDDVIDPGVGIEVLAPRGAHVREGEPVLMVHHRGGRGLDHAMPLLTAAIEIGDAAPAVGPLVVDYIRQEDR